MRGDAIVRARTAEEVPLATAVGLHRPRAADRRGAAQGRAAPGSSWSRRGSRRRPAAELDALALTLDDQAAFAKLSRRLLEDLDLAAAEDPLDDRARGRRRRRGGRRRRQRRDAPSRATKARPAAATSRCAARRPRTSRPTSEASRGDGGRRGASAGRRRDQRKRRSPRPGGATGTCRRRPTTRPSPPASTRSSRPTSCATRRSSAGSAPISTSRWAGFRTSSPGSPTGSSGG